MFLSKGAFDDTPAERPRTGGFNTVSRTLNKADDGGGSGGGSTYGGSSAPLSGPGVTTFGRHGVAGSSSLAGIDYYRPAVGPGAPKGGSAALDADLGSAGALPTTGESRSTALERQKQLHLKRRTEAATGGLFTASRPIDGPSGAHGATSATYTPGIPQFSSPKTLGLGESLRPSTAGSSMSFGTARPGTGDASSAKGLVNDDAPVPTSRNENTRRAPATKPPADLNDEVDTFVTSPETRPAVGGKAIGRRGPRSSQEEDTAAEYEPPARATRGGAGGSTAAAAPSERPSTASRRAAPREPPAEAPAPAPEPFDPSGGKVPSPSGGAVAAALRVRTGGMGPASVDLSDIMAFISNPTPKSVGVVQCYIERDKTGLGKKVYPVYQLYLKEGDRFLLAAKKRPKQKTSNYLISRSAEDLNRDSDAFVGKLRSNFVGTEFSIYDDGVNPEDAKKKSDKHIRHELAVCTYASNVFGSRGPRKMRVFVPRVFPDGVRVAFQPTNDKDGLLAMANRNETTNIVSLINKPPKWNDQVGAYVLNFNGRVTMASVKNFQLVPSDDHESVVLQFGRVGKDLFTMDYQWPLSPLQAFAICLSSFDYKLACE